MSEHDAEHDDDSGLRQRLTSQTEEVLGRIAQDLLENRLVNGALTRAFEARHRATQAQEVAMGALNIPSAADIERLTRRLRSVSTRLEGIEESVERLDRTIGQLAAERDVSARLGAIEEQLSSITRLLRDLDEGLPGAGSPVPRAQERLAVEGATAESPAAAAPRPRRRTPTTAR